MGLPTQPVTLNVQQIEELNRKLSMLRHDINNHLGLMMAAAEMVQFKPDTLGRMITAMNEQPGKITSAMARFSQEFEQAFGITR